MKEPTDEQAEKLANEIIKGMRPTSWPLLKFAYYSLLVFITTASISGAIWAVVSLARWL